MRLKITITALLTANFFLTGFAQNKITCHLQDAATFEKLRGANVVISKTNRGASTDSTGTIVFDGIPNGTYALIFSNVGYKSKTITFRFPLINADTTVELEKNEEVNLDEVIVSSSRTGSRIENMPTKVEVLGEEEVNEEVGIKPGNIASLLGDVAGIQTQQTSATTGNTEMRVQGLPGKYTQILKDGVPLFGGYSSSFSIMQIPPLDLKQIEIVKGASSTLYGGGAIAGMINFISKKPKEGIFEKTILFNQSTLYESNVNIYLSNRKNKLGYTFFTGMNYQKPMDVNKDGFSDLPDTKSFFVHPTLFIYPDNANLISIGYNGVFENRNGGDMLVLKDKADTQHQYFNQNRIFRNTIDINWENKINSRDLFNGKATGSWLNREIDTHTFGMKAKQLSWFSEVSYLKKFETNDLVAGINITGEHFTKKLPDSTQLNNYNYYTLGVFMQDDWRLAKKWTLQSGLRFDHHNEYGDFVLPRLSLLYKINPYFTTRLGAGLGYKIPTVFSSDVDERDYPNLLPLSGVKAESSTGANWDINYHQHVNAWDITINQMFYITGIADPIVQNAASNGDIFFANADKSITTSGFETYIQVQHEKLEIYLGYTYTVAKKLYDDAQPYLSLSARNKFASVLAYEFTNRFRTGVEAALTGVQYLDNGNKTPAFPFVAAMMRYDIHQFSFVLNCENLFDYRQTRQESIVSGPISNPIFAQLWAPIDGRVVNLSMRIRL